MNGLTLCVQYGNCVASSARRLARGRERPGDSVPAKNLWASGLKRVFDVLVASAGLILLAPLLAFIAVAIRSDSRGPVLFRQERIGRGFRPFQILKFRTMVEDAPRLGGSLTAGDRDPRITRVGRILRRMKLDELPQLINVVRGDMSLVGPRPEVRKYVELYRSDYERLLSVRPGITDPASLAYRNEGEILGRCEDPEREYVEVVLANKIAISTRYVESLCFATDMHLIAQTLVCLAY